MAETRQDKGRHGRRALRGTLGAEESPLPITEHQTASLPVARTHPPARKQRPRANSALHSGLRALSRAARSRHLRPSRAEPRQKTRSRWKGSQRGHHSPAPPDRMENRAAGDHLKVWRQQPQTREDKRWCTGAQSRVWAPSWEAGGPPQHPFGLGQVVEKSCQPAQSHPVRLLNAPPTAGAPCHPIHRPGGRSKPVKRPPCLALPGRSQRTICTRSRDRRS